MRNGRRAGRSQPETAIVHFHFNAWAKYTNYHLDEQVGAAIAQMTGLERIEPRQPDNGDRIVLEGGGIEVNGAGKILVTSPLAQGLIGKQVDTNGDNTYDSAQRLVYDAGLSPPSQGAAGGGGVKRRTDRRIRITVPLLHDSNVSPNGAG